MDMFQIVYRRRYQAVYLFKQIFLAFDIFKKTLRIFTECLLLTTPI